MKRFFIILIVSFFIVLNNFAQVLTVSSFEAKMQDLHASTHPRNDLNDTPCGLVKVQATLKDVSFSGTIIGDVEHNVNEYYVYMPAGTKRMKVNHSSYLPLNVEFSDFGISKIESKVTYVLVLTIPNLEDLDKVTIKCNEPHALLYVDDRYLGDVSSRYNISNGIHSVRLIADGYYDYNGNVVVSNENKSLEINMTPKAQVKKETFTIKGEKFDIVLVEGGMFEMGATKDQLHPDLSEKPKHQVSVSDFYIGETEVTQGLWMAVMGTNPSKFKGENNRPVEQVSWDDCMVFIQKLNELTGKTFRLPTEAEWEYAARGGKYSYQNQFAGSGNLTDVAWYGLNSFNVTHPIKEKVPNELGLYDMSGNVGEWINDKFGQYSEAKSTNPKGSSFGNYYVIRGGAWDSYSKSCRVAHRDYNKASYKEYNVGLRLAM